MVQRPQEKKGQSGTKPWPLGLPFGKRVRKWLLIVLAFVLALIVYQCATGPAEASEWAFEGPKIDRKHVCVKASAAETHEGKLRFLIVPPDRMGRHDAVLCSTRHAAETWVRERVPDQDRPLTVVRRVKPRQLEIVYRDGRAEPRIKRGKRWYKPWTWWR